MKYHKLKKLSLEDRNEIIRLLWKKGYTLSAIAKLFGLTRFRICQILKGKYS